jgi:threo-3-hydroxy-L-aspartate ammonia-lyase
MTFGPTLADLRDAHSGLAGVGVRTPLVPLDGLGGDVRLKAEYLQPISAFKIRGAWTALSRLAPEARVRGVVTASSGNHGLGLATAAAKIGVRAVIVMPESAPRIKQERIAATGADVRLVGAVRGPEQTAEAERLAAEEGLALIPPYDHLDVIAGQGTCALEILEDWPEVGTIVVPTGGGGLLAGTCAAVRALGRDIRVIAVEPEQIPKISRARAADAPVTLPAGTSLADGMLTRSIGDLTWPIIREVLTDVVAVPDAAIRAAMRHLDACGIRLEPSGATPVAAVLTGQIACDRPTALIASGGNVDPLYYADLIA